MFLCIVVVLLIPQSGVFSQQSFTLEPDIETCYEVRQFFKLDEKIVNILLSPNKNDSITLTNNLHSYVVGLYCYIRLIEKRVAGFLDEGYRLQKKGGPKCLKIQINEKHLFEVMQWNNEDIEFYKTLRKDVAITWEHFVILLEDIKLMTTQNPNITKSESSIISGYSSIQSFINFSSSSE